MRFNQMLNILSASNLSVRNQLKWKELPSRIWHLGSLTALDHDDVIKWIHFPRCWPFVRRIHQSPVTSPHKGQRRGALMFSLICVWINGWVNRREAGDLRRCRAHYDVTLMRVFVMSSIHWWGVHVDGSAVEFVLEIKFRLPITDAEALPNC